MGKEKIKRHYLDLGLQRFLVLAVITLIVLDLINSYYLRIYWVQKDLSMLYVKQLGEKQGINVNQLSKQSILEIKTLIDNGFFFFLFIIFINNLFFYFFYLKKKLWAQGYIVFYAISNALLALLFLIEGPILGLGWFLYNLSTVLFYSYLFAGAKILKFEKAAIPGDEKTEQ